MTEKNTKKRVFVVDDNQVIRRLLAGIIRQDESLAFVGEAVNGEAAIAVLDKTPPDVICLDIHMPRVDGLAVLEHIRKQSLATAAVLITGYATAEIVQSARDLGAAGVVVKPFNPGRVLSVIHSALSSKQNT